jgi:UDP:flavonoid glycosyltransferase YjiC (YdhE family)
MRHAIWIPQASILAHVGVVAYITQGGLQGAQEALYHGKPVIVLPYFVDQVCSLRPPFLYYINLTCVVCD